MLRLASALVVAALCAAAPVSAQPAPDAINLADATIVGGSPDVKAWAKTASITSVHIGSDGVAVAFDAKGRWPDVTPPGWDGPLQYTLWLFVQRNGTWTGAGVIEFWRTRPSSGAFTQPDIAQHVAENWIRDGHWGFTYAPALGETVGFMVTAGDQRVKDVHAVAERSNVVLVPLRAGETVSPEELRQLAREEAHPDASTPNTTVGTSAGSVDHTQDSDPDHAAIKALLADLRAQIDALRQENAANHTKTQHAIADLRVHVDTGIRQIGDSYLPMLIKVFGAGQLVPGLPSPKK
jgi:hypothetical protein